MLNFKKTIPVVAAIALVVSGFNPLLKMGLEKGGSAAFGAKTEIAGFMLNPFFGRLDIRQIQVANKNAPMTNLFEVGAFRLGISAEQMFYKRLNIERATIDNIRLGTPRRTSGALPVKTKKAEKPKEKFDLNKFTKEMQLNPEAVANAFQTAPPQASAEAARVQKENEQKLAEAKKLLAAVDVQKELAALKLDELNNLNISNAEDVKKLQSLIEEKQAGLQKITTSLEKNKAAAEQAVLEAQNNLKQLEQIAQKDIDNLLGALDIGNYDLGAIGKELLGPKLNGWLETGTQYLETAKKYMPPKKTEKQAKKKDRLKGETVVFPNNKTRPRFWIGRLGLSGASGEGTSNELKYSGYITDIASEQYLIGKPTVAKITGAFTKRAQSNLDIAVSLDRRNAEPRDIYEFFLSGYDLAGARLWDEAVLPLKIVGGLGQVSAVIEMNGEELNGDVVLLGKNMRYAKDAQAAGAQALAAEAIMSAPELKVSLGLSGTPSNPQISIKTNIDALIKARLEKEFGDQVAKAREQVAAEYAKTVGNARQELDSALKQQEQELTAAIAAQQAALNAEQEKITAKQKEIETQIQGQTDALKKQAEDALKNAIPGLSF